MRRFRPRPPLSIAHRPPQAAGPRVERRAPHDVPTGAGGLRMRLQRLFAVLFAGLLLAMTPRAALAEPVVAAPRDAPLVLQPNGVRIPPVPTAYSDKDLGWLRLRYVPGARERVEPILHEAEAMKSQLRDWFGAPVLDQLEVRVARTPEEMAALAPDGLPPPEYATGVAYAPLHLVLLSLSAPEANADAPDIKEVFFHELVHIALYDAVQGRHVPRWFNEGLAIHVSGESRFLRLKTLWEATISRQTIPLADLDSSFPQDRYEVSVAYAESADFVRFLLRDPDRARFVSLIERVRNGAPFDRALADAYGTDLRKLEFQWREEIAKRYTFLPVLTSGSLLWVLVFFALVYGYAKKRRKAKETLERWAREEAALDAAKAAAAAAAAAAESPASAPLSEPLGGGPRPHPAGLPRIEYEGRWHTLH
ncbi:peptidase MA family metallohydrolase [Pendulispora albinea]|uniref:Peptidase MA-like domain-containing protein n=1 Tax=Pendulispora albinea TaxID=2741071 RepID=A0ABZ2LXJ2_9BACT